MSEQTSNPNSGQNVPKSKFRRKSRQEQTAASKLRMARRGEELDAAREKLAKQKPPKKPGAVKRLAHTAGHGVHGFVHGKLYEVEHENVGTEGAHRSELAAESVYRFGRRKLRKAIREHPAKAVERAESKHIKATADYYYRKTVEPPPTEIVDPGESFTEDGNLVTRDLLYDKATNKQFITVQTSGGNTFYIVIDYDKPTDEDGEQYHTYFLNMVDEADLLAAMQAAGGELPECSCADKCAVGAINTDCIVCAVNMGECQGKAPEPAPVEEP